MPDPTPEPPPASPPQPPPGPSPAGPSATLIPCPACARPLSPKATACPSCGHPIAADKSVESKPEKPWEQVKGVGQLVLLVVSVLLLGVQAVLLKLVGGQGVDAEELLPVLLQTAPLTLAVAFVGLAVLRKWVTGGPVLFLCGVALLASLVIGVQFGQKVDVPAESGNLITFICGSLAAYWRHYGPGRFVSALLVGGFLAWAGHKLWPRPAPPPAP